MTVDPESFRVFAIRRFTTKGAHDIDDHIAVEEPMEIRVRSGPDSNRSKRSVSITMRTPGHDFELAAGFLFTERILTSPEQIRSIVFCGPPPPGRSESNIVRVETHEIDLDLDRLQRHFFTSSSCGICGKVSLEALEIGELPPLDPNRPRFKSELIYGLPDRLRSSQPLFDQTGGLHAAGLVDAEGTMFEVREDVGRHNAVDKLLGRRFLDGTTPLGDFMMVVSGRASFEILQKALAAGVPGIIAVGAPSSLAVDVARRFGMTLVGFTSPQRFNVYSGSERIL
jgi:FdhD protein